MRLSNFTVYAGLAWKAAATILGGIFGNLYLRGWGVRCAGPVKCVGIPSVNRSPAGEIRLGKKVCLRSARCANRAGCLNPVILNTIGRGTIEIGSGSGISGSVLVAEQSIRLGKNVLVGVGCRILDTDFHPLDAAERSRGTRGPTAPVVLEDNVWLGMNVTVLKGVRIGCGSVVGAGSIVVHDIPAGVLAGGNPARVIRKLEKKDE